MIYGYKFKCPWCNFWHYVTLNVTPCSFVTCPIYKETFKVVLEPVICLACSTPCKDKKITVTEITNNLDPMLLKGVKL